LGVQIPTGHTLFLMPCEDSKLLPRWLGFRLLPELSIPNTHEQRKKEKEKYSMK
jgi:hypothetical protein